MKSDYFKRQQGQQIKKDWMDKVLEVRKYVAEPSG